MFRKTKFFALMTALSACVLLIAGTYAWTNRVSSIVNSWWGSGTASSNTSLGGTLLGGTLHNDYYEGGDNKDIYVENWGEEPLYVRIYLAEYMEIGQGAGIKNDSDKNKAVSLDTRSGIDINEPSTWTPHDPGPNNIFKKYWDWNLGGWKYYFPAPSDLRGRKDAEGIDYVDSSSPENLTSDDKDSRGVYAKKTLDAGVMTMDEWANEKDQPIGSFWVMDTDGWSYWAQPLLPGEATGLLIDGVKLASQLQDDYYFGIYVKAEMATQHGTRADGSPDNYEIFLQNASDQAKSLINKIAKESPQRIALKTESPVTSGSILSKPSESISAKAYLSGGATDVKWDFETSKEFTVDISGNEAIISVSKDGTTGNKLNFTVYSASDSKLKISGTAEIMQNGIKIEINGQTYFTQWPYCTAAPGAVDLLSLTPQATQAPLNTATPVPTPVQGTSNTATPVPTPAQEPSDTPTPTTGELCYVAYHPIGRSGYAAYRINENGEYSIDENGQLSKEPIVDYGLEMGSTYTIRGNMFKSSLQPSLFYRWFLSSTIGSNPNDNSIPRYYAPGTKITITCSLDLESCFVAPSPTPTRTPPDWVRYNASPIVLDLDGNGVRTTSLEDGVIFDYAGGYPVKTAWADPNCGFLVRDLNGNGQIDNGAELFGDYTFLKNGERAGNGFIALKELDLNKDGKIDRDEAKAAGILIWRDANGNGKVEPGEFLTFEEAGVLNVETSYKVRAKVDENGNMFRWVGTFTRSEGSKASAIDILFVIEETN